MGDYDYGSYAVHRTGVAPFGNGPFYNSLPLWSYKPSMTASPPSSVIATSAFAAPRRQALSEAGTTRELHRSPTVLTARSLPQEYDNSQSGAAWYQKTKQALSSIPAMFEARASKGNNRDLERYNRWQPQDIEANPTTAPFLSLPAKPVSVFQANRSQATSASSPDQSAFSKPHSVDGLNERRQNPSVPAYSAAAASAVYNPSASANPSRNNPQASGLSAPISSASANPSRNNPQPSGLSAPVYSESAASTRYNPSVSANPAGYNSSAFANPIARNNLSPSGLSEPVHPESAASTRYNPSASANPAARHNPSSSSSSAPTSSASDSSARHKPTSVNNRPEADDRSANGHLANSRVLLKASPASNSIAQSSGNYPPPRLMAGVSPPPRSENVDRTRSVAVSALPRTPIDQSLAQKSGQHSKYAGAQSRPSENALGHTHRADSSTDEGPRRTNFPSTSPESRSKEDYGVEPSGQVKFNPLFESSVRDRGDSDLSSAFAMSPLSEVGLNRHPAGSKDHGGVRSGNRLAATKVNEKSASALDEKQIVKDAFQFLDNFDE